MVGKSFNFDLINNARDSLNHAVEHLTGPNEIEAGDLKRAIRDVAHVIELLLKERLRRVHPAFIWEKIDKYPSTEAYIINTNSAVRRLVRLANLSFTEDSRKTISACKKIRDSIEHYEFRLDFAEARGIIGRMLSFIFDFSKNHLGLDLETEFRADDRWGKLIEIYEFVEAHGDLLEKHLSENNKYTRDCPWCGAMTFDVTESKCVLCGHAEPLVQCSACEEWVLESEIESHVEVDYDMEGPTSATSFTICERCIDEYEAYDGL